ncbi:MAG: hypothetical protein EOP84_20960 [Verrucomicrobiaceae bacterium]|nr:MAG: hypothetical protein EOP84_20960 [Verrucomicrobiaceae bacterium]
MPRSSGHAETLNGNVENCFGLKKATLVSARWIAISERDGFQLIAKRSNPSPDPLSSKKARTLGKDRKWRFARWFAIALGDRDPPKRILRRSSARVVVSIS